MTRPSPTHLVEDLVNDSPQSLLCVDIQLQRLLRQRLELLRSELVEDTLELAVDFHRLLIVFGQRRLRLRSDRHPGFSSLM